MKYAPEDYAEAFFEVISKNKNEKVVEPLLSLVRKNGDWGSVKKIYRIIADKLARHGGGRTVKVEFARKLPEGLMSKIIESFSEKDFVESSVKPELAAGARVLINAESELDFTLLRKLKKLFP